jgi:uncharacterized protein YaaR (DUF327 family)
MSDLRVKGVGVEPPKSHVGEPAATSRPDAGEFSDSVKIARKNLLDGELKKMLEQTRVLGEAFFRGPNEEKLEKYKQGIKEFLEKATKELFALKQEFGFSRGGQQKVFQLVETVNREVDTMTRENLLKDKALQLLGTLDDIRGLILDLFG